MKGAEKGAEKGADPILLGPRVALPPSSFVIVHGF